MKYADIIVPFTDHNENAVSMLVQNLQIKLKVMKQQKHDIIEGLRVRTFSDIISTPDIKPLIKNSQNDSKSTFQHDNN